VNVMQTARVPAAEQVQRERSEEPDVLSYSETALILRVSERTLERWVRERRIPFVRLPRRGARSGIRFVRAQVVKWLEQQTVRPARWRTSVNREGSGEEG